MKFLRWAIDNYESYRGTPLGDLIEDMKRDTNFPQDSDDPSFMRSYLLRRGACHEALVAFTNLWIEFLDQTKITDDDNLAELDKAVSKVEALLK